MPYTESAMIVLMGLLLLSTTLTTASVLFISWSIRREIASQIAAIQQYILQEMEAFAKGKPSLAADAAKRLGQEIASGAMGKAQQADRSMKPRKFGIMDLAALAFPQLRGILPGGNGQEEHNHAAGEVPQSEVESWYK